ncbi:MAG: ATP-binding protein, partial [bacterium]
MINYFYKDKEITKIDADKVYKLQKSLQTYKKIELIRNPLKIIIIVFFVILTFLLINLAIWVSFLFAKKIISPIQELIKGTEEIACENFNYQIPLKGKNEFEILIKSFNKMIEDLRKHKQELISTQKIATWKEMAQELAHEIKNPLTPIKLCAERLEKTYKENSKQYEKILKESTNTIIQETENLESLINEFSEFARIPNPIFEKINVNEIINTILELYSHLSPKFKIKENLDKNLPLILGDFEQLKRVFINLVKNAIESLSSGGEIKIKTFQNNFSIQIEIQDEGCGISEKIKDKIFYPHFSNKKKGMGLGLAIVHRIMTEHNGSILIESKENQGTTVKINLPIIK